MEEPVTPHFSPRQREVAHLLAAGSGNRQIAEALVVSTKTVEAHISKMKERAGVATTRQLVVYLTKFLSQ